MRHLLDPSKCSFFNPTFDNRECQSYAYAEDSSMNPIHGECGWCTRPDMHRCLADITRTVPISHSSLQTFLTCHYLYWLQKYRGIRVLSHMMGNGLKAGALWDKAKQKLLGREINLQDTIKEYSIDEKVVAKIRALFRAYKELEISVDPDYSLQASISINHTINLQPNTFFPTVDIGPEPHILWQDRADAMKSISLSITGFYDRKYSDNFTEDKCSGRPEYYLDPWYINSQCGTYFLADPNLKSVTMEVVQFPQQKSIKQYKEESPEDLYKRVYSDILSRPSAYFIGWDRERKRYGKKFYRGEFDLLAIEDRYRQIIIELSAARWSGCFYKREKSCDNIFPGIPCDYRDICKTGTMSEQKYYMEKKGSAR